MLIYCPTQYRLYYGKGMSYDELMGHIKRRVGYQRAPRGSLEIRTGKETWTYQGQVRSMPASKLKSCMELPSGLTIDATPFLVDGAPSEPDKIRIGDRVEIGAGSGVKGTVVHISDISPFAAVDRDDKQGGAGPNGSWLCNKDELVKISEGAPVSTISSAELEALRRRIEQVASEIVTEGQIAEAIEQAKLPKQVTVTVQKPDMPDVVIDSPHCMLPEVLQLASIMKGYAGIILVGPAGTGKSTLCEQVAQALEAPYYYTPQAMFKTDIVGCHTPYGYVSTPFREAYTLPLAVHTFEEFDSYSPQAGVAANVGLANGHMTFPDSPLPVKRGENVVLFANMNTWGNGADRVYVGRNQLDAATLNRFVFVEVDYDTAVEAKLCQSQPEWLRLCWKIRKNAADLKIRKVVSTRQVVAGRMLLDGGMSREQAERFVLREGLSDFDWNRLTN